MTKASDEGRAFFEELVKGLDANKPIKILDCVFADPEKAEAKFVEDKEKIAKFLPNIILELAAQEKFIEQVKDSQVIFFRGGETDILLDTLNKCGNWAEYLDGKTVAGTSAGAMMLAKYSHALEKDKVIDGLGLVPVKVIAHWESPIYDVDWGKALMMLRTHGDESLPLYNLKEGEFVVISQ